MTPADAALDRAMLSRLVRASSARCKAVLAVLQGREVQVDTYDAVLAACVAHGVEGVPPLAPRAPRTKAPAACPACAAKDVEIAGLRARVHQAGLALMAKDAELAETERQLTQAQNEMRARPRLAIVGEVVAGATPGTQAAG